LIVANRSGSSSTTSTRHFEGVVGCMPAAPPSVVCAAQVYHRWHQVGNVVDRNTSGSSICRNNRIVVAPSAQLFKWLLDFPCSAKATDRVTGNLRLGPHV
jgi:hypothetical protein